MKVNNLKELKQLILLCRKHGVDNVKVDGMEFHLAPVVKAHKPRPMEITDPLANISIPKPNIKEEELPTTENELKAMTAQIANEGLTPEQLLNWSVIDDGSH